MRKITAFALALVMMTAIPIGVLAQEDAVGQSEEVLAEPAYYAPEQSGFSYSEGVANGTYLDFNVDEETGIISDFTVTMIDYNYYYPMIYYEEANRLGGDARPEELGNDTQPALPPEPTVTVVKFFDSIEIEGFVPNGHPAVFGQSFYFMGENALMSFYDYSGGSYQFGEENATVTMKVSDGLGISETPYYWDLYAAGENQTDAWKTWEQDTSTDNGQTPVPLPVDENVALGASGDGSGETDMYYYAAWDEVWLRTNNTICSISVSPGEIEMDNATGTLTVTAYSGAYLSFLSWTEMPAYEYSSPEPWMNDLGTDDKGLIETAIEGGLFAAAGYLFVGEGGEQYSDSDIYNDPTFTLEFQTVTENDIQVQVQSEIQEGRIVSLNLNKGALNASNEKDLKVLLDGSDIKRCDSIEELTEMQGGTEAGYYIVLGDVQNTVFVYVPHFSTHTINVQSIAGLLPNMLIPGLLAFIVIAAAVALVIMRGRKKSDDF
jgi:hypothetical protein